MEIFILALVLAIGSCSDLAPESLEEKDCSAFSFNQCTINLDKVIEEIDDTKPADCQAFCQIIYPESCSFFMVNERSNQCILFNATIHQYLESCMSTGGPVEPTVEQCIESSDSCKNFVETSCSYSGEVIETLHDIAFVDVCQRACQIHSSCQYFVYSEPDHICDLISSPERSCDEFIGPATPSIEECKLPSTSSPTSIISTIPTTSVSLKTLKFLVVGGETLDYDHCDPPCYLSSSDVEMVNPFSSTNKCKKPKDYPVVIDSLFGDRTSFCGGHPWYENTCYDLIDDRWVATSSLIKQRADSSSIYLPNNSFWVVGGLPGDASETSEIRINEQSTFIQSTDLPINMSYHCMSLVNTSHVFIAAIDYPKEDGKKNQAYMVNIEKIPFEFTLLPPMMGYRKGGACGTISSHLSSTAVLDELIVAGGIGDYSSYVSSEIFSFETYSWRRGPSLPRGFFYGGYYSSENHPLILVSGQDGTGSTPSDIMAYELDTNVFQYLPGTLETSRYDFAMSGIETEEDC